MFLYHFWRLSLFLWNRCRWILLFSLFSHFNSFFFLDNFSFFRVTVIAVCLFLPAPFQSRRGRAGRRARCPRGRRGPECCFSGNRYPYFVVDASEELDELELDELKELLELLSDREDNSGLDTLLVELSVGVGVRKETFLARRRSTGPFVT